MIRSIKRPSIVRAGFRLGFALFALDRFEVDDLAAAIVWDFALDFARVPAAVFFADDRFVDFAFLDICGTSPVATGWIQRKTSLMVPCRRRQRL